MAYQVVTGPTSEPITLTEAKLQCHVDQTVEDTLITGYIGAAREWCEAIDWRAYITQTIDLYLDAWPASGVIELPRPPLQSVTSIKYTDDASIEATFAASNYIVDAVSTPGRIVLKSNASWPSVTLQEVNGIVVRYIAGWTTATIPGRIRQALLLLVAHWYNNREAASEGVVVSREIEFAVNALLGINRAFKF